MPDFFTLLAFYYACDQGAIDGTLRAEQVLRCADAYRQVKTRFLTQDELDSLSTLDHAGRSAHLRNGYLRFKIWEDTNPALVDSLRRQAEAA